MNVTVNQLYWLVGLLFLIVYWLIHANMNLRGRVKSQDQRLVWQDNQLELLKAQMVDTRKRMDVLNTLIEDSKQ